ncbi:MAG TPA: serine hydrolase domain-containing protein [Chryseolinea sp.]|nr:serine hydrolase domain-containing protein [Chryseolinea sp.]HPH47648.1 serine hydrolase domain-containing protein [Chryseolinea sp.]HPM30662.1 serine hydrolase domain-containing protein [Chryseolinea sp.]
MKSFFPILIVLLFIASCQKPTEHKSKALAEATPESGGFSSARLARLDSAMQDWVKKKWINGSVALIARNGKIVFYKSAGYNDVDVKEALAKDGIFRIASQTKAITSVAVMMLWEEGKFSLNDPISKFIPAFANQTVLDKFNPKDTTYTTIPVKRPSTIRDLLSHTSGIGYATIGSTEATAIYAKNKITAGLDVMDDKLPAAMTRLGTLPLCIILVSSGCMD